MPAEAALPLEAPSFGKNGDCEIVWKPIVPTPAVAARSKSLPPGLGNARAVECPRHGKHFLTRENDVARCAACGWTKHSLPPIAAGSQVAASQPAREQVSEDLPKKSLPDFLTGHV